MMWLNKFSPYPARNCKSGRRNGSESGREKRKLSLDALSSPLAAFSDVWFPCPGSPCSIRLASKLSEGYALADNLRYGKIEATRIIKVFTIVEAEHLFVEVAKQVKRLHANVGFHAGRA